MKPKPERLERQEIHCHNCGRYVQFTLDVNLNGNHVLHCPNCNHEHCRVVRDGKITDIRWDQRNGPTYSVITSGVTITLTSTFDTSGTSSTFLYYSWANAGSTCC